MSLAVEYIDLNLISFFFSPSIHDAFADDEKLYKDIYEKAEIMGFEGNDCSIIYSDCKQDLLSALSNVVFN